MGRVQYTKEETTNALFALVQWGGKTNAAARHLKAEYGLKITPGTLEDWKTRHGTEYDEIREKYSGQIESRLANEYREAAGEALEGAREAVAASRKRIESGEDQDPARSAANLARVAQSSTDKLMTLTSRPTQITETRDMQALLRSLAGMGVIELSPEPEELPAAVVESADAGE